MKNIRFILSCMLLFIIVLSGCNNNQEQQSNLEKNKDLLTIYTTVYPLQFFVQEIGGKFVQVETIYPPGTDEHTFEPSQKDMIELANADLFFYIGLGLEGFVEKAKDTLKNQPVTLVAASENLSIENIEATTKTDEEAEDDHDHEYEHEHAHGDVDPHVWLDPLYTIELAESIKNELVQMMPQHEQYFTENYTNMVTKLQQLDDDFKKITTNAKQKRIIVSHAAFGYWEMRYDIEQISVSGLSTTNEPTQKQLEAIIETANKFQLKYILFEQNVTPRLVKIVQKEIGAESLVIHNLGVLTEQDLINKEDYFSLMNNNLAILEKALNNDGKEN